LGVQIKEGFDSIEIGKAEILREGIDTALLAVGTMVDYALSAAKNLEMENITCRVVNMRFIKPLDYDMLDETAERFNTIFTLEENSLTGGFGSSVAEYLSDKNFKINIVRIGLPDKFIDHGTQEELHHLLGIDPEGITQKVSCALHDFKEKKNKNAVII
jgi:1-deoxy-D-xylulose-5-phosphate synthase